MKKLQFLLLEDSILDIELIQATLQESQMEFDLLQVQTREQFIAALQSQSFDLILSDYSLPDFDGISALQIAQQFCPQVPFILVSAALGEELAIETLKSGATDYVLKQRLERLVPATQRALREAQERQNRQRAEVARQEAESQYRLIFEQSPFGVLLIRIQDYTFVEFNTQAHQQLGYSREEFSQLQLSQIEAPESPTERLTHGAVAQQQFDQFETKHRTKSGQLRDVLVTTQMITIGGEQYLHSIWQDITERKQAELILQERNERLKILYEATSDLLSTDQPVALLDDLFQKLSRHIELHCYLSFLVEQAGDQKMLRLIASSGLSAETVDSIQYLEAEKTICGLAIAANRPMITPRVQQSTEPRAAIVKSLGLTAYASYPLYARGRLLGTLSFGSRSRTEFSAEELALLQATADQVAMAMERANLMYSLQQQTEQLTQANRVKDEFLAVLSHELRTPLNPILGWARLLRSRQYDAATTDRALEIIERNAKIQTQLIEDLLDVSRILRGKLSLTVAPVDLIAVINAGLETVRLAAEAKSIELQFVIDSSLKSPFGYAHQDYMLGDLRAGTAQLPTSNSDLQTAPHPPTSGELPHQFHSLIPSVGQTPHSPISPLCTPHFQVLGDASRLQQVVWNLLSNAVKFTPEGGRVEVKLEVIDGVDQPMRSEEAGKTKIAAADKPPHPTPHPTPLTPPTPHPHAQITVTDTGRGIGADFLPHVFDYFRQADGSTTRVFGGLGLGLAIVRHLTELHGGTVAAHSLGEGQGATFTIRLPLQAELSVPIAARVNAVAPSLLGVQALVVDDEKDALELITFLLEQSGASVVAVASVDAALEALQQIQPDILISDIGMPNQDGYMLLHQVRHSADQQGSKIPAIALTAYAREEDSDRALAVGFQKHLTKPVEPTDLLLAVAELVKAGQKAE